MFSRFFIDRPIFASVLSIVIVLAGAVSYVYLPLAQYPPITPPTIQVMCTYPGASAQVVAQTIAAPIEQQVNGVENMLYMSSQCANDGSYSLAVTFEPGVNLNFAQVLVQNRVNLALPLLPDVVKMTGVTTRKRSPDILELVSLISPDNSYDQLYLSNYATLQVRDELVRVDGVGDVFVFGQQDYSMRVWVDPGKLSERNLTATDVVAAIREQNAQVATGQIGQPPAGKGQQMQITLSTLGRLETPEQFADIVLKAAPDGRTVRIRDIGWVELGPRSLDTSSKLDGKPCVSLAIFQLPDANALDTSDRVKAKMEELKKNFPAGITYDTAFDTTPFIRESVNEVYKSLRDAVILVAVVVLLFLQNWRSAIIPLVAVPVAIVGTFAAMAVIHFSLNNLTLFGLVLAIGIVVDDAIVVVEAVEHHIEHGLAPREATIKAMEQVSGPVIAVGLVLSAVFVPCAFISGITGQFFRQFALTIAVSTIISAFNSLTLSPALAALLLKPRVKGHRPLPGLAFALLGGWAAYEGLLMLARGALPQVPWIHHLTEAYWAGAAAAVLGGIVGWLLSWPINLLLVGFFWFFNLGFQGATSLYTRMVGLLLRGSVVALVVYGGLLVVTYLGFTRLPVGYIPAQDKGYLLAGVQLPEAASLERTREVVDQIDRIAHGTPGVGHTISVAGQAFALGANGPNFGTLFIPLQDFSERRDPSQSANAIAATLTRRIAAEIPGGVAMILPPPPVSGLGTAGGYKFLVEDRGSLGLEMLQGQTQNLIAQGSLIPNPHAPKGLTPPPPALTKLFSVFRADSPQLFVDVNRDECAQMGMDLQEVFSTLQIYLGSLYVNDFNRFGRTWSVVVQAEAQYRNRVEEVKGLKVRSAMGRMVPLGTLATIREVNGPLIITRYNMYPAASVTGDVSPGVSSGEAVDLIESLASRELPRGMAIEWTEITFIQLRSGNTAMYIFGLAVFLVFLVLAALYESWALPLAVILVVPMCLLGSIVGVMVTHSDINIFTQIGFVVLVGLASKNAILIVEFAKYRREEGVPRYEATLEACKLRLRPILMTSFAFILGVVPLMLAKGAGAEMRQVLGTAVFSGMLGVTIFGVFFTPVFFYVIQWASDSELFASPLARRLGLLGLATLMLVSFGVLGVLLFLSRMLTLLFLVLGFGGVVIGHMAVRHLTPLVVARAPVPPISGNGPVKQK